MSASAPTLHDFFISYASEDLARAHDICEFLERCGASYWLAPESILPGEPFPLAISQAIRSSAALLLVYSHFSDVSEEVMSELALARKYRKRIIPIRVEPVEPTLLEYYVGLPQWVEWHGVVKSQGERQLAKLAQDVRERRVTESSTATAASMSLRVGQRLGPHEVVATLDADGFSARYKVHNVHSGKFETVVLLTETGAQLFFENGIKALARLDHPNIMNLKSTTVVNNVPALITEYVEATSVEASLHQGPLKMSDVTEISIKVLSALSHVHSHDVLHRDIKPRNILVGQTGEVKLTGFYLACIKGEQKLTPGTTAGSLYYMSPEQIRGEYLDERTDIYSLGVCLYEIVTGQHPYVGKDEYEIMVNHLQQPVPDPRDSAPGIDRNLAYVIRKAMQKDKSERFQTAQHMQTSLHNAG